MINVKPQDVKDYTSIPEVKSRSDKALEMDIRQATRKVLSILNRKENDVIFLGSSIPQDIKDAIILYAEYFANQSVNSSKSGMQSEKFDDYSYSRFKDGSSFLDVSHLLDPWINYDEDPDTTKVVLRMRAF